MTITKEKLVIDLTKLGVRKGDLLNVKASLKSIGYLEGGAQTLIEALLEVIGPEGTIVTDSFVSLHPLPFLKKNAHIVVDDKTLSYAGALANAMIKHPQSIRSKHPIQKFSLIGYRAQELAEKHTGLSYPYGLLKLMAEQGGRNLKIGTDEKVVGVGTTHVVIGLLEYEQKRLIRGINYLDDNGNVQTHERDWVGGCGKGFNNLMPDYRNGNAVLSEGQVGLAPSKITDMGLTMAIELELLKNDPEYFKCNDPGCFDCRVSWKSKNNRPIWFLLKNMSTFNFKAIYQMFLLMIRGKWYSSVHNQVQYNNQ